MEARGRKTNRKLYDRFWKRMPVTPPQWFSTWKLVGARDRGRIIVEIGPGTRPRAPLPGAFFLDLSLSALKKLKERGGRGALADCGCLPLRPDASDVVVAFDVLEHVENDENLFHEIGRILRRGGTFIFSVPLHASLFDRFDLVAGHLRRYDPEELVRRLTSAGFSISAWCPYGVRPRSALLNRAGAWWMERYPSWCAWIRDLLFRNVGRYFQAELHLMEGDVARVGPEVAGVLVKARKGGVGSK